ncbi:MAG: BrnT family toxin, partial [Pyrinomonadaceae bacterium]
LIKHEISFERATNVFLDPNALSIPASEHSETEERWLTIAIDSNGILLLVSHTFVEVSKTVVKIRIISARKATKMEMNQYEKRI